FTGAAKKNLEITASMAVDIKEIKSAEAVKVEVMHSHIIIDGIFGTGLTREVGGLYKDVISLINSSGKKIVSIDIPSGINGDTGEEMGIAVAADYTVALGLVKRGNLLFPGFKNCGKLYLSHISFPPELHSDNSIKVEINSPSEIPERDRNGHKGDFGDVLFIAGAANYYGAPYFCSYSFLKAGGGYSRLAAPGSIIPFIAAKGGEIVFLPQEETEEGSIALSNKAKLLELSEKVDMVVIGPGLSLQRETVKLVKELAAAIDRPLLLDGDGITAISENLKILKERKAPTIITPHPGEMARITSPEAADKDNIALVQKWASELDTIIVLKGGHSLVGYPEGRVLINLSGNSGMATAGSGDVLCGTIAAAFGLGLPLAEAAGTAVFLHGLAGDLAASVHGEDGITARDILAYLPESLLYCRNHGKEIRQGFNNQLYLL
ncbi:MAG: NAD(P)H-hydrate dehydratase, partial [Spirochaeta sp.]|nr:NAD(P)H-hydrate dehydratase [Spirochaeta sp.]